MIQLSSIARRYRYAQVLTTALNAVDLQVDQGEFVAIMGTSGCGKSTLLNILGLIDQPTTGTYMLFGKPVNGLSDIASTNIRREHIGFVFQSFHAIPYLSVFDNVELPLIYTPMRAAKRRQRVLETLMKLEILHRKHQRPQQLSGGQQQRVAIARALVNKPSLLLADEPTGNLDSANATEVMKMLVRLNREGTTVIIATHSLYIAKFSSRVIELHDGTIISSYHTPEHQLSIKPQS